MLGLASTDLAGGGGEAFADGKRRKEISAALTASLRKEQLRVWSVRLSAWFVSELPTAYVQAYLDGEPPVNVTAA